MARKSAPGPSLFGEAHMAPVARASVEPTRADVIKASAKPVAPPQVVAPPPVVTEAIVAPVVVTPPRALRLVPPIAGTPEEDVIVEPNEDGHFVVSTLRHHGTTSCSVIYTRAQLEMLVRRGRTALEIG